MKSFTKQYLNQIKFDSSVSWLIGKCMEYRGRQDLWLKTRPEILNTLKETAIIQSSESSNRIEGVVISEQKRLEPLLLGKTKPKDRPEEEILGYKKALNWIHKDYKKIQIKPEVILQLHKIAQGGFSGDAGKWKEKDNEIIEILPNGERRIRFKTLSVKETPKAITQLCLAYTDTINQKTIPELIVIASFVLDFLCIHPFRDGNGRVGRLLSLLCLHQNNYLATQYISLEQTIEETKEDYYRTLYESSINWHEEKHNSLAWWIYFLSTLKTIYQELETKVESKNTSDSKGNLIRQIILEQLSLFTLSDIQKLSPSVSIQMIKKVLSDLKNEGLVELTGKGRGAKWKVNPVRDIV